MDKTIDFQIIPKVKLIFDDIDRNKRPKIRFSAEAIDIIKPYFNECMQHHEEVYALLMNNANKVMGIVLLGVGGVISSEVNQIALLQAMILSNSKAVILAHNHPSGDLKPSINDKNITNRIKKQLECFDFLLLDHIIFTEDSHLSMADEGMI